MDVGNRLKFIRNRSGHSQESLAESTGLTRSHLQKLETNVHSPTVDTLNGILIACNSTLAEFFESRIPDTYPNPADQDAHEKLQLVLDSSKRTSALDCLEAIYRMVLEDQKRAAPKRAASRRSA